MAFENLEPHRDAVLAARAQGATIADIIAMLASRYEVKTSQGTVSKFLRQHAPHNAPYMQGNNEALSPDAESALSDIKQQLAEQAQQAEKTIEQLSDKVDQLSSEVENLRRADIKGDIDPPARAIRSQSDSVEGGSGKNKELANAITMLHQQSDEAAGENSESTPRKTSRWVVAIITIGVLCLLVYLAPGILTGS